MTALTKERQKANLEIVEILRAYFEKYPDQRFHQGLVNLDIVVRPEQVGDKSNLGVWRDEYNTEPKTLLGRIKLALSNIANGGR